MEEHIGKIADVPEGEARRLEVAGLPVCVVNLGGKGFRAIGGLCSHAKAPLHEGEVDAEDETIECPRHGAVFDLNTGRPRSLPATVPVAAFAVRAEGDDIVMEMSRGDA
jgi:3-phenylpropionate/trans-cinnamate dioxygenase ferredoxin subunit